MSARMTIIIAFACLILIGIVLMLIFGNGGGVKTFSGAHFIQEDNDAVSEYSLFISGDNSGCPWGQGNAL